MDNNKNLSKEEAIIEFLKLPQEYDYMMVSPLQVEKQLKNKYLKEKIFEAKGTVCEICGSENNITIHHKTYEMIMPKGLKRLAVYSSNAPNFKLRLEKCEEHNRKMSKKYFLYPNEDYKWKIIDKEFPDFFKKTIENMEVLCLKCYKKKHEEEMESFMPLHSHHTEEIKPTLATSERRLKSSSNYYEKMAQIKEQYPNAYEPWSNEADDELKKLYSQGKQTKELCELFGRQPGGIKSRLKKLGLIE